MRPSRSARAGRREGARLPRPTERPGHGARRHRHRGARGVDPRRRHRVADVRLRHRCGGAAPRLRPPRARCRVRRADRPRRGRRGHGPPAGRSLGRDRRRRGCHRTTHPHAGHVGHRSPADERAADPPGDVRAGHADHARRHVRAAVRARRRHQHRHRGDDAGLVLRRLRRLRARQRGHRRRPAVARHPRRGVDGHVARAPARLAVRDHGDGPDRGRPVHQPAGARRRRLRPQRTGQDRRRGCDADGCLEDPHPRRPPDRR